MELLNSIKSRTERNCPGSQSRKRTAQIYWNLQKSGRFRSAQFSRIEESDLEDSEDDFDLEEELATKKPRRAATPAPAPAAEQPVVQPGEWKLPPSDLLVRAGAQSIDRSAVEDRGARVANGRVSAAGITIGIVTFADLGPPRCAVFFAGRTFTRHLASR